LDLWRFLDAVTRRLGLIILVTGLAAGATFLVSTQLPKQYEAETQVLVGSLTETDTDQLNAYERLAQTYATLSSTSGFIERVVSRLTVDDDPVELASRIEVRVPTGQSILRITAEDDTPADAQALADAVAAEIVILATPPQPGSASLASVVQPATGPTSASSPRVLLNTLVAGFFGLALGLGLAVLLANGAVGPRPLDVGATLARPNRS
jgi:capsular polysaccharide biosynthesis protein